VSVDAVHTQIVSKILEARCRETLCHHVGELLRRGYMKNLALANSYFLPDEVNIKLYVLRSFVMHWV
jgi:hypothetical protein